MTARTDRQPRQRLAPDERREAIRAAAADLFGQRGYAGVSVAEVARGAGASEALVYRYFDGKPALHAAVVGDAIHALAAEQRAADAALGPHTSARDRVRTSLSIYLDFVATHPVGWAARYGEEAEYPRASRDLLARARAAYVAALRAILLPGQGARHEFAMWGYFGFLDASCQLWVEHACPAEERDRLIDAALGALEGALGDWGR